jgi:uncharacterized protein (TIGR03086 family)
MADDTVVRHTRACDGFAAVANSVTSWDAPSPCTEWDARGVVEHVIGFHEILVLRPLGVKANRPREDAAARWRATQEAILEAIGRDGVLDEDVDVLGGGQTGLRNLVTTLTTDMLVHTWDLARADGQDVELDHELCRLGYERAAKSREQFEASDMFGVEVEVADDADVCSKLLGIMGRDPRWEPPKS